MHFPAEKIFVFVLKNTFPAETCGFQGAHSRKPQEIAGGLLGSRRMLANLHKTKNSLPSARAYKHVEFLAIFDVYVFVLNSNSLTNNCFSCMCICICFKRNSCEKDKLCVSNSKSMVLGSIHMCFRIDFVIQVSKTKECACTIGPARISPFNSPRICWCDRGEVITPTNSLRVFWCKRLCNISS